MSPMNPDIVDPALALPLELGWKREVVYRARPHLRKADTYYYSPEGAKCRSFRELQPLLTNGLTSANFSFKNEPLGILDPSKEIVRSLVRSKSVSSPDVNANETNQCCEGFIQKGMKRQLNQNKCHHCDYIALDSTALISHVATHAIVLLSPLRMGNLRIVSLEENHVSSKPPRVKTFNCSKCPYATSDSRYLSLHSRLHSTDSSNAEQSPIIDDLHEKRYSCYHCSFKASKLLRLRKHVQAHIENEIRVCVDCGFQANDTYMRLHSRLHEKCKRYTCDKCTFDTSTFEAFQNHLREHDNEAKTPHQCPGCNQRFSKLNELRTHLYSHTPNIKPSRVVLFIRV